MASTRRRDAVVSSRAPIARPDDRQERSLGLLLLDEAVGKTPGEPAGSLLRVGS
jgi:hypothetical protein